MGNVGWRTAGNGRSRTCLVTVKCVEQHLYTVEEAVVPNPGTWLVLHLNDSSLVLLDDVRLWQAIKKYATTPAASQSRRAALPIEPVRAARWTTILVVDAGRSREAK